MLDALSENGVQVEKHLHAVGLDRFKVHDPMAFLPGPLVCKLFNRVNDAELSSNVLGDLGKAYRLKNMAHWGEALFTAPDLLTAAVKATRPEMSIISFNRIELVIDGPVATIIDRYDFAHCRARRMIEELSSCLLLDGLAEFGGVGCRPLHLDVTGSFIPEPVRADLSRTRIRLLQPELRVSFPTGWLSNKPVTEIDGNHKEPDWGPGASLSERVSLLFNSLEEGRRPTLDSLLAQVRMPRRKLQRQLAQEGTSFFELLDTWSMTSALEQIADPVAIAEISESLGYSDPAHFSRAFKRWTGSSPAAYRDELSIL